MSGDDIEEGNQKRFPENKNIKKKDRKKKLAKERKNLWTRILESTCK